MSDGVSEKEVLMKIQVAGPGCPNCQTTEKNVFNACAELNLPANISHVFNVAEYLSLGVTRTPAVLVDGEVVLAGKVPTVPELVEILAARR
jgi:small redox-active disulfide protein 2